jgi:hypothetical protein
LRYPKEIKVIEVFPDEGSVERLLYLLLKELNERLNSRKLRGFKEIKLGNYHALLGEFFYTIKRTLCHQAYINKSFLAGVAIISIILTFYYYYSISIRGYVRNILSVISQRLDYLIASYTALKELKPSLHLENLIYPLVSYVPRDLWTSKPFPVNAQLTYIFLGIMRSGALTLV